MAKEQELEDLRKSKDILEAQLASTKKELDRYRSEAERLSVKFSALSSDFSEMSQKFATSQRLRVTAETEVSGLRKEIEDLSSALFSEANEMVSTARKSENDYKQKNKHLQNEIEEKDLMIETYKQQLNQLKDILETLDKKSLSNGGSNKQSGTASPQKNDLGSTTSLDNESLNNNNPNSQESHSNNSHSSSNNDSILSNILYAPPVQSLRYDLELFNFFLSFAKHASFLVDSTNTNDYSDIKETRFYKRILHDDIQPTLRLDTAPGVSFLQKRSLMSAIVNGRVIIEPISSVNESFKRNSNIASAAAVSSRPIATPDPCSICGEGRNDALEHARLYMLKIYSSKSQKNKTKPGSSTNLASANNSSSSSNINDISSSSSPVSSNTATEFTYTFPLCAYCVFRIRSTCELYAFLRSIKSGVWKFNNEVNQKKAWIECTRIRLKMFWSRQGIWDSDSKIVDNKVFNAAQIIGDNFINGNINNSSINRGSNSPNISSFQFQEKKQVPENYRHSYAGTIGSYMEKYGFSVSSPQKETVSEVTTVPQEPISLESPESFKANHAETVIQENEDDPKKQQHHLGLHSEDTDSSDEKKISRKSIQPDVSGKISSVNNNPNKEIINASENEDAGSDDKEEYASADEDEDSKVKSSIEVAELTEKVQATNL